MNYIFFFLEFILLAVGAVSAYTYSEIIEEHDHSENAQQISLVNTIFSFGVVLITSIFYFYKTLSFDRLVVLTLFSCIIAGFISFAIYYLLWKEDNDYNYDKNKNLREANEIVYILTIFLAVFIIGLLIGEGIHGGNNTGTDTQKNTYKPPLKLVKLNVNKPTEPVSKPKTLSVTENSSEDLMDDFIGKNPEVQKVIIL